ncbi:MAG: LicD family protein [Arcanobacterium sp.]|nr:LicD family protein [Arcanobacterium sp.]
MPQELSVEDLRQMQEKSWAMYEYFADFCDRHGLIYYACGGCCIGAIRDGGFVPWDDDVDVFMPRPDYEKLAHLWPREADRSRYIYVRPHRRMVTGDLMAKICDVNTTLVTTYQTDKRMPQGLTMDVLPLDGCPNPGSLARKEQKILAMVFSLFCAQSVPENHGGLMAWGSKILLSLVPWNNVRYHIWRWCEKRMSRWGFDRSQYTTELASGPKYMRNEYRQEWFAAAVTKPFGESNIKVPAGYDPYLRTAFGDYMTPPPPSAQHPTHAIAFLDLNTPYKKYVKNGILRAQCIQN